MRGKADHFRIPEGCTEVEVEYRYSKMEESEKQAPFRLRRGEVYTADGSRLSAEELAQEKLAFVLDTSEAVVLRNGNFGIVRTGCSATESDDLLQMERDQEEWTRSSLARMADDWLASGDAPPDRALCFDPLQPQVPSFVLERHQAEVTIAGMAPVTASFSGPIAADGSFLLRRPRPMQPGEEQAFSGTWLKANAAPVNVLVEGASLTCQPVDLRKRSLRIDDRVLTCSLQGFSGVVVLDETSAAADPAMTWTDVQGDGRQSFHSVCAPRAEAIVCPELADDFHRVPVRYAGRESSSQASTDATPDLAFTFPAAWKSSDPVEFELEGSVNGQPVKAACHLHALQ